MPTIGDGLPKGRQMNSLTFRRVNAIDHGPEIHAVTFEYFDWMNREIERVCNLSLTDITGVPLDDYVEATIGTVCSGVPPKGVFYLIEENGLVAGSGGLRQLPDGAVEIVRIFTRPHYRGRGYGLQILSRLLVDARSFGYTVAKLDTGIFMKSAHRIYEALGFEDCPRYEGAEAPDQLVPYWRYMSKNLR
jgi:GNAT superfamily N-acetyltransferase